MTKFYSRLFAVAALSIVLQGCVAFPPLIQVEHKDDGKSNADIASRLDRIDERLNKLEEKIDKK